MSETKKFTDEELNEIKSLRDSYASKVTEFGQIEIEILATQQRQELLHKTKEKSHQLQKVLQEYLP